MSAATDPCILLSRVPTGRAHTRRRRLRRTAACFLAGAAVALGSTSSSAHPPTTAGVAAARSAVDSALAARDFGAALERAEDISMEAQTEYLESLFTILRIRCLEGNGDKAYKALDDLLAAGWWDHQRLYRDPDLALINQEERFRAVVRKAWSRQYISMLERESRDAMQKPDEIMATLAFKPGETVADVGAGSGYFTVRIARAVGETGRVIATDIRQEMLDYLADRVAVANLTNVELVKVEPDDPHLPPGGVDTILMVDVFHYIKERVAYGRKLRQALAPGGRLVVIDFRYDPNAQREFAPPIDQQARNEVLDEEMREAGFTVAASYDFLPEQYFVVYTAE